MSIPPPSREKVERRLCEIIAELRPAVPANPESNLDLLFRPGELAGLLEDVEQEFGVCLWWHEADRAMLERSPFRASDLADFVLARWGMLWGTCETCRHDLTRSRVDQCPGCGAPTRVCGRCGFDLTGSERNVCPECGEPTSGFQP